MTPPPSPTWHGLRRRLIALAVAMAASAALVAPAQTPAPTPAPPLDVNQASEADLDSLRGVGPALTARILAQRAQAPFADWADLLRRVKGIRSTTAQHLAEQGLTVNGQGPQALSPPEPTALKK